MGSVIAYKINSNAKLKMKITLPLKNNPSSYNSHLCWFINHLYNIAKIFTLQEPVTFNYCFL